MRKTITFCLLSCLVANVSLVAEAASRRTVSYHSPIATPQGALSAEQMDNLLAPIALYPDPLLAQGLPASTFVDQIDQAARRLLSHNDLFSRDEVADNNSFKEFATHVAEATKLERQSDARMTLLIGSEERPFPIPLVKNATGWSFDTKAGTEEILNRRIGKNEIAALLVSQAYAVAQWEYFDGEDRDHDQVSEYAQKLISSPNKQDGLYFETDADEEPSPLGLLVAFARKEGYTKKTQGAAQSANPFHGYYFKILTRQGSSAPGGAYNYIINGNMIAGFALVACPAVWGNSGVMTFVVNQEGRVYEKNLGPRTAAIAGAMTDYNPDSTWSLVRDEFEPPLNSSRQNTQNSLIGFTLQRLVCPHQPLRESKSIFGIDCHHSLAISGRGTGMRKERVITDETVYGQVETNHDTGYRTDLYSVTADV